MKEYKNILKKVTFMSIGVLFLAYSLSHAKEYIYIFSHNGKFLKLDPYSLDFIDLGNLWWLNLYEIERVIQDGKKKQILLMTSKFNNDEDMGKNKVSTFDFLSESHKGDLYLSKTIKSPDENYFINDVLLSHGGGKAVISLDSGGEGKKKSLVIDLDNYSISGIIEHFNASRSSCFSLDGSILYSPLYGNSKEIEYVRLDGKDGIVYKISYEKIGDKEIKSMMPVVCKDGILLIRENAKSPLYELPLTLFFYDMQSEKVISKIHIDFDGMFYVLSNGKLLINEKKYIPNEMPDGSVIGIRSKSVGRLHLYDIGTGSKIASIPVHEEGEIVGISSDAINVYYFSSNILSRIDLQNHTVVKEQKVPFMKVKLAFYRTD